MRRWDSHFKEEETEAGDPRPVAWDCGQSRGHTDPVLPGAQPPFPREKGPHPPARLTGLSGDCPGQAEAWAGASVQSRGQSRGLLRGPRTPLPGPTGSSWPQHLTHPEQGGLVSGTQSSTQSSDSAPGDCPGRGRGFVHTGLCGVRAAGLFTA